MGNWVKNGRTIIQATDRNGSSHHQSSATVQGQEWPLLHTSAHHPPSLGITLLPTSLRKHNVSEDTAALSHPHTDPVGSSAISFLSRPSSGWNSSVETSSFTYTPDFVIPHHPLKKLHVIVMTQEGALNEKSGKPVHITSLEQSRTGTDTSTLRLYKAFLGILFSWWLLFSIQNSG